MSDFTRGNRLRGRHFQEGKYRGFRDLATRNVFIGCGRYGLVLRVSGGL
jgi:hypothetical protein